MRNAAERGWIGDVGDAEEFVGKLLTRRSRNHKGFYLSCEGLRRELSAVSYQRSAVSAIT